MLQFEPNKLPGGNLGTVRVNLGFTNFTIDHVSASTYDTTVKIAIVATVLFVAMSGLRWAVLGAGVGVFGVMKNLWAPPALSNLVRQAFNAPPSVQVGMLALAYVFTPLSTFITAAILSGYVTNSLKTVVKGGPMALLPDAWFNPSQLLQILQRQDEIDF